MLAQLIVKTWLSEYYVIYSIQRINCIFNYQRDTSLSGQKKKNTSLKNSVNKFEKNGWYKIVNLKMAPTVVFYQLNWSNKLQNKESSLYLSHINLN